MPRTGSTGTATVAARPFVTTSLSTATNAVCSVNTRYARASSVAASVRLSGKHLQVIPPEANGSNGADNLDRIPLHEIDRLVVVGKPRISMSVLHILLRQGCPITMMSRGGRLLGTMQPPVRGSSLLRIRQLDLARDEEYSLLVAEGLIFAKISNSRQTLIRLRRNRKLEESKLDQAIDRLEKTLKDSSQVRDAESLRGIEGAAAATYFSALESAFPDWAGFKGRNRRPPRDPANAVLSFLYTLVTSELEGAVVAAGLDPCVGFFHGLGYGRPSLVLDLLEPYRAPVCDLLTLHLFGHRILTEPMFEPAEKGGIYLNQEGKQKLFVQYEQRMDRPFRMRGRSEHTSIRRLLRDNALPLRFNPVVPEWARNPHRYCYAELGRLWCLSREQNRWWFEPDGFQSYADCSTSCSSAVDHPTYLADSGRPGNR